MTIEDELKRSVRRESAARKKIDEQAAKIADLEARTLPRVVPRSVYDAMYRECEGFVDCPASPQEIWDACLEVCAAAGIKINGSL